MDRPPNKAAPAVSLMQIPMVRPRSVRSRVSERFVARNTLWPAESAATLYRPLLVAAKTLRRGQRAAAAT